MSFTLQQKHRLDKAPLEEQQAQILLEIVLAKDAAVRLLPARPWPVKMEDPGNAARRIAEDIRSHPSDW